MSISGGVGVDGCDKELRRLCTEILSALTIGCAEPREIDCEFSSRRKLFTRLCFGTGARIFCASAASSVRPRATALRPSNLKRLSPLRSSMAVVVKVGRMW